jgi:hypothetical protein
MMSEATDEHTFKITVGPRSGKREVYELCRVSLPNNAENIQPSTLSISADGSSATYTYPYVSRLLFLMFYRDGTAYTLFNTPKNNDEDHRIYLNLGEYNLVMNTATRLGYGPKKVTFRGYTRNEQDALTITFA